MADQNWKSRLFVEYSIDDGPMNKITPIDSFQPTFSLNTEALHSIEDTHIGVVHSPPQIGFSISCKAIGTSTAELTKLAIEGRSFSINLGEKDDGDQWSLTTVLLEYCFITNATPTSATISGVPSATFSGFALGARVDSSAGEATIGNLPPPSG